MTDRGVEDARAVKMDMKTEPPALARRQSETLGRHGDAAGVVVRIFKRKYRRIRMVDVVVGPAGHGKLSGVGNAVVVAERIGTEPGDGGKAADLGAPHMGTLPREQAFAVASHSCKGKKVAHRSRAGKESVLLPRYLRRVLTERVRGGIVPVDVVPNLGAGDDPAHLLRRFGNGIASKIHYFMVHLIFDLLPIFVR